jgi:uncharacterized integral membrane protein
MNGWSVTVLLGIGWALVVWATAEATAALWVWPLGVGIALLVCGGVLLLVLVSEARNNPGG